MAQEYWTPKNNGEDIVDASDFNLAFNLVKSDMENLENEKASAHYVEEINEKVDELAESTNDLKEDMDSKAEQKDLDELSTKINSFSSYGGSVSNYNDFPINPKNGTICEIIESFSPDGYYYNGVADELLVIWDGTDFGYDEKEKYIIKTKFTPEQDCIFTENLGFGEERFVYIYDKDGLYVGQIHVDNPISMPLHYNLNKLGAFDREDIVSFYISKYRDSASDYNKIPVFKKGEFVIWNGFEWKRIPSVEQIYEDLGNIDRALINIIQLQEMYISGGIV